MTDVNQKVYNVHHQMTARTDRSDFNRYSAAYATGRQRTPRNESVDVLRCGLMFLIVLYHCAYFGIYNQTHAWWLFFLTTMLMWHVDCFVAISGWFGIRTTLMKFIRLWGVVFFYSIISFIVASIRSGTIDIHSFSLRGGWFLGAYLALMLMAPLLNASVEGLAASASSNFWHAWGLGFLMMILAWIPGNLFTGVCPSGVSGISLFVLCFVYVTVRGLRVYLKRPFPLWCLLTWWVLFALIAVALQISWMWLQNRSGKEFYFSNMMGSQHYHAPHIIVMAISVLLVFVWYVKVPKAVGVFAKVCAPSMFAVYLLHGPCSFGHDLYQMVQRWIATSCDIHPMLVILMSAVAVWVFCTCVDLVRRGALRLIAFGLKKNHLDD